MARILVVDTHSGGFAPKAAEVAGNLGHEITGKFYNFHELLKSEEGKFSSPDIFYVDDLKTNFPDVIEVARSIRAKVLMVVIHDPLNRADDKFFRNLGVSKDSIPQNKKEFDLNVCLDGMAVRVFTIIRNCNEATGKLLDEAGACIDGAGI